MEENNVQSPKLLISFVVDNGSSMQGARAEQMAAALQEFAAGMAQKPQIEWEMLQFGTFTPVVAKPFDGQAAVPFTAGKMPLLGRAVTAAMDRLEERTKALAAAGVPLYRPWLFILSDGFAYDEMEEAVARLEAADRAGKLLYMPFKMRTNIYTDRLQCLDRTKHMIEITGGGVGGFFAWVTRMAQMRLDTPPTGGIKFSKNDFEGWAVL